MIPKIIHFVWVGDQPKSDLLLQCIESWKKYLPDYEIREWGNDALDQIENRYAKEAFTAQKWAFVADYLRLYALYHYGGIYLDADTEVTASLDQFLEHKFFSGFEVFRGEVNPFAGVIGSEKKGEIVGGLLDLYQDIPFILADRSYDMTTSPRRYANHYLDLFGYQASSIDDASQITELTAGVFLYPYYYFCTPELGKPTYAIHHYAGSWCYSHKRNDLFSLGNYTLVRFRRNKRNLKEDKYPLHHQERVVFTLKITPRLVYALLKFED